MQPHEVETLVSLILHMRNLGYGEVSVLLRVTPVISARTKIQIDDFLPPEPSQGLYQRWLKVGVTQVPYLTQSLVTCR